MDARYRWTRNSFNFGDVYDKPQAGPMPKRWSYKFGDSRDMLNRDAVNFLAVKPSDRNLEAFLGADLVNEELFGATTRVSFAPFKATLNNPLDTKWIKEKNRRLAAGESHNSIIADPPFGRQQRTEEQIVDFNSTILNIHETLQILGQLSHRDSLDAKEGDIGPILIKQLGDLKVSGGESHTNWTTDDNKHMGDILNYIKIPLDPTKMGLKLVYNTKDLKEMKTEERGKLILYLFGRQYADTGQVEPILEYHDTKTPATLDNLLHPASKSSKEIWGDRGIDRKNARRSRLYLVVKEGWIMSKERYDEIYFSDSEEEKEEESKDPFADFGELENDPIEEEDEDEDEGISRLEKEIDELKV